MRLFLLGVCLVVALHIAEAENWTEIGTNEIGTITIDSDSIKRVGDIVSFNLNMNPTDKSNVDHIDGTAEVNCKTTSMRDIKVVAHDAVGNSQELTPGNEFQFVPEKNILGRIAIKFVCGVK